MRYIAYILALYISIINVTPAICSTYITVVQTELCCNEQGSCGEKSSCSSKETEDESSNNKNENSSCIPCCYVQCCQYNFSEVPRFNFQVLSHINSIKIPTINDKIISDYTSDCWRPPEII